MSIETNRNAIIRTRTLRNGNLRVETARRDSGINVSLTSDRSTKGTRFSLTTEDGLVVRLNGRSARTLFRVLSRYYDETEPGYKYAF